MPRPIRPRLVHQTLQSAYFKPLGVPMRHLAEVRVGIEEMEAIRLKDILGLKQVECAEMMGVSRPTFHRVLRSGRRKIAEALLSGSALRVEGGHFAFDPQPFRCRHHDQASEGELDGMAPDRGQACPECISDHAVAEESKQETNNREDK